MKLEHAVFSSDFKLLSLIFVLNYLQTVLSTPPSQNDPSQGNKWT